MDKGKVVIDDVTAADVVVLRKALSALNELESCATGQDVANRLIEDNVRGYRQSSCNCPLATYLRRHSGANYVMVWWTKVGLAISLHRVGGRQPQRLTLGNGVVSMFVREFDAGSYRALDAICTPGGYR